MADQAELVFVRSFVKVIGAQPIVYSDDYNQPPQNSLKKVPILPVELPPVPERKGEPSTPPAASISITFKSTKPPQSFTLAVQPTDTVSEVKALLASQPNAPPAEAQRLLLKGKALADAKLLKEYSVKEGDTINLMLKPGFEWDPTKSSSPPSTSPVKMKYSNLPEIQTPQPKLATGHKHTRTPSIVLSPSPSIVSLEPEVKPHDIDLTLDTSLLPTASISRAARSSYQTVISEPPFWDRLYSYLRTEFSNDSDALIAFEDFLRASKGGLTASEIAKIRDHVGVVGMAGT
ncbi:ubiquitin family-domain-containing protein [Suillus fuscotomentosus]|uniref:Ubiquitin family-domain-containing protein n=1 Tax=Suillus fuscotomentosus TaxID=1912939 RepID=A0AAD4HMI7_9AGAM|nr:ubiquitin family-domain-containing protein [Suillus fuscotomentosus]KAG1902098.1 ubiquitin family-domain-containing protein [Suillus fuscotomentosus]